jgi:hypothetical protein
MAKHARLILVMLALNSSTLVRTAPTETFRNYSPAGSIGTLPRKTQSGSTRAFTCWSRS